MMVFSKTKGGTQSKGQQCHTELPPILSYHKKKRKTGGTFIFFFFFCMRADSENKANHISPNTIPSCLTSIVFTFFFHYPVQLSHLLLTLKASKDVFEGL